MSRGASALETSRRRVQYLHYIMYIRTRVITISVFIIVIIITIVIIVVVVVVLIYTPGFRERNHETGYALMGQSESRSAKSWTGQRRRQRQNVLHCYYYYYYYYLYYHRDHRRRRRRFRLYNIYERPRRDDN